MDSDEEVATGVGVVRFEGAMKVGEIHRMSRRFIDDTSDAVTLDIRAVSFIDVPSLLFLLAQIRSLLANGRQVWLRLPRKESCRSWMWRWGFPAAIEQLLRIEPLEKVRHEIGEASSALDWLLFDDTDRRLAAEAHDLALVDSETTINLDNETVELLPKFYYRLKSYLLDELPSDFALEAASSWDRPHVASILKRIMGHDAGSWVARYVIFELCDNAVSHPNAHLILHGSQHEPGGRYPLVAGIWDDGEPIHATLRRAIEDGLSVNPLAGLFDVNISLSVRSYDHGVPSISRGTVRSSQLSLSAESADWQLLLGSLMPGVSRRAQTAAYGSHPGLGLHGIAQEVSKTYGGVVHIRSGNFFLVVRPSPHSYHTDYAVDLFVLPPWQDSFCGNLIAVTLPPQWSLDSASS